VDPAAEVLAQVPAPAASAATTRLLLVEGRVALEQGRTADAVGMLRAVGGRAIVDTPSALPWRSTLALALAADDPETARALADEELARARWFGQPRGLGIALRACGLLRGDGDGMALLAEAVAVLRG